MFKYILVALCTLTYSQISLAVAFSASFWEKELCSNTCLPTAIGQRQILEMQEPEIGSFSSIEHRIEEQNLSVKLSWFKKAESGGYSSFQIEVFSGSELIALCTRYEGLESLENAPVGACAGRNTNKNNLLGFSIALP